MTENITTRRGLLGSVAGACCPLATCTGIVDERTDAGSWEVEADRRIADHRRGDLRVTVRGPGGLSIPGADVSVTMKSHDFGFGTSVDARYLVEETSPSDPYRRRLAGLFNRAVVEHRNKWKPWENESERELAVDATSWLRDRGMDLRGHAAIWQRFEEPVVPDDVVRTVQSNEADRDEYVARRSRNHVSDIVGFYDGTVAEWDVVNEQLNEHRLTDVIDPGEPPERAPEVVRWFERAREADSEATLYLNEYNVLAGNYPDHVTEFETLIEFLLGRGVDLGGVGMQSHHDGRDEVRPPEEVLATLDRFAGYGVELQVTEYDTDVEGWTEEDAAEHLRTFLKAVFSHPAVEGFVMWGFWDGAHWRDNAPLYREDWTSKPALDVYRSLVFDDWWTDERGRTDLLGEYETEVFLGDHEIVASFGGASKTRQVSVTDPGDPAAIEIQLGTL